MRRVLPVLLTLVAFAAACERVEAPPPTPPAEFIVAAGDSVFWIRSDAEGIRVRGAPMMLALVNGRFAELYVADDDHSFYDAVYVGQRLYKRDIVSGDSMLIARDTLMPLLARAYAMANPDERPLAFDEQGSEMPRTMASAELLVLDVMGPWVSYEYRTDVDIVGGTSSHGLRRAVVDLRTGSPATLDALFGRRAARAAIAEGQRQWREYRDSLLAAAPDDEVLREELARLSFDARSFTLVAERGAPQVRFALAQSGAQSAGSAQLLFPVPVDTPPWWEEIRAEYPTADENGEVRWAQPNVELVARPQAGPGAPRVAFALRDAGAQEWALGFVPAPVTRVMWLGDSLAAGTRAALLRAFDEASLYSEDTRVASGRRAAPRTAPRLFRHAALEAHAPRRPAARQPAPASVRTRRAR